MSSRVKHRAYPAFINQQELSCRNLKVLPTSLSNIYKKKFLGWDPILKELFVGIYDIGSPLHLLIGLENTVFQHIYSYTASHFLSHITLTIPASCVGMTEQNSFIKFEGGRKNRFEARILDFPPSRSVNDKNYKEDFRDYVAFAACGHIKFPIPDDRNVNMLPFTFGDKSSLPLNLQCYFECINQCPIMENETGKVGYLTVHEGYVESGQTQRRGGLHIESPRTGSLRSDSTSFTPAKEHSWGLGHFFGPDKFEGGIYIASSVKNSTRVWDVLVDKVAVDKYGGCEYLRPVIGPGTILESNQLVWMTDRTPHEAIPQEYNSYRQFFRVVTSQISHWHATHCTPNPNVQIPDYVQIIHESKFEQI